jgi:uncharacterized RDD family membrane protein YckC
MNFKNRNEKSFSNDLTLAPIKKRFLAFLIDWVVIVLIYFLVITVLSLFSINDWSVNVKSIFDVEIKTNKNNPSLIILLKILFGFLPVLYFTILAYCSNGQTIGKFLLRIKIVSLYHEYLGVWHCFERSLGYFTSALEFGFGFIQALWNPNRMTLHDKIGETIVISIPRKKRGNSLVIIQNNDNSKTMK